MSLAFLVFSAAGIAAAIPSEGHSRYAPSVSSDSFAAVREQAVESDRYWRTPDEVRAERKSGAGPLSGLRVALDPGHIGGDWAEEEGREFRIADDDFFVREGDLVLEVAQIAVTRLEALGAEVFLLRENSEPVNPKSVSDYARALLKQRHPPDGGLAESADFLIKIRDEATRRAIVTGELVERARLVNKDLQPDLLVSLHIDAAPWPDGDSLRLVRGNYAHVLIFGAMTSDEFKLERQRSALGKKLANGSGETEFLTGRAMAEALKREFALPPLQYGNGNAVLVDDSAPHVWARNLLLLRLAECPAIMVEPFMANSEEGYEWLQNALRLRAAGESLPEGDALLRYANAVVAAIFEVYGARD